MRIITRTTLKRFGEKFADARGPLNDWAIKAEAARWSSFAELRKTFSRADEIPVGSGRLVVVFNIKGNRYRLIAAVHYNTKLVFVLRFMTHAEYDKNAWKETL